MARGSGGLSPFAFLHCQKIQPGWEVAPTDLNSHLKPPPPWALQVALVAALIEGSRNPKSFAVSCSVELDWVGEEGWTAELVHWSQSGEGPVHRRAASPTARSAEANPAADVHSWAAR